MSPYRAHCEWLAELQLSHRMMQLPLPENDETAQDEPPEANTSIYSMSFSPAVSAQSWDELDFEDEPVFRSLPPLAVADGTACKVEDSSKSDLKADTGRKRARANEKEWLRTNPPMLRRQNAFHGMPDDPGEICAAA